MGPRPFVMKFCRQISAGGSPGRPSCCKHSKMAVYCTALYCFCVMCCADSHGGVLRRVLHLLRAPSCAGCPFVCDEFNEDLLLPPHQAVCQTELT